MATYKILYWQDVPTQVCAEDGEDEVKLPLAAKFMEQVDRLAMHRGLAGTDDYLAQWKWSDEQEREGSASEVAEAVKADLESRAEW